MQLQNKTILITGSTDGLGKLLALELAKKGANIVVTGRDSAKTELVLQELTAIHRSRRFTYSELEVFYSQQLPNCKILRTSPQLVSIVWEI